MGKSHIRAWQAPENLGHSDLLPDPREQDYTGSEAGLARPMFPSHQILGTNSSGHPFQKGRTKGQVRKLLHWKRGLGTAFSPAPGHMGPRVLFPTCPSLYPKGFSDLQTTNAQRRKHLPKIRMTTTAQEQGHLTWGGLLPCSEILGASLEIISMGMYPPVPLPWIKVPHSKIHGACPILSDEGMKKA